MKSFKRLSSLLLVVTVLFGVFSMTVFADDSSAAGAIVDQTVTEDNETVSIKKEIVFVNAENTTVREPNITYTYTLSAVTSVTATVKDSAGLQATVKPGVAAAISTGVDTIVFKDTVTGSATPAGTPIAKYADLTFDQDVFTAPGIYRYQIVETQSPTKATVGVTEEGGTYNTTRFLDVYVCKKDATLPNAAGNMKIYGYVLYEDASNSANISFNGKTGETLNLDKKSDGFTSNSAAVDTYETQNVDISKVTTGVLADKGHDFPIHVTLTKASGLADGIKLDVTKAGNGTLTTSSDAVGDYVTWGNIAGTVRDGSTITISGVPVNSTVAVVEDNDTPDTYKVKAGTTAGAADLLAEAIVDAGASSSSTSTVTLDDAKEIHITNTLDAISPTGYVVRFAPFAFMFMAGIVLLMIKKKMENDYEED